MSQQLEKVAPYRDIVKVEECMSCQRHRIKKDNRKTALRKVGRASWAAVKMAAVLSIMTLEFGRLGIWIATMCEDKNSFGLWVFFMLFWVVWCIFAPYKVYKSFVNEYSLPPVVKDTGKILAPR